MIKSSGPKWVLSAEGTLDEIRDLLGTSKDGVHPATSTPDSKEESAGVMQLTGATGVLRSKDSLSQIYVFQPTTSATEVIQLIRDYWTILRDKGLADANPVKIYVSSDDNASIVFAFRWKTAKSRTSAQTDSELAAQWAHIRAKSTTKVGINHANEIYQGFEYKGFPKVGGVELLRGKCTCRVKLDAFPEPFELDGQNGFVIMHRGPRQIMSDSSYMPVMILDHGADSQATDAMMAIGLTDSIRVEQNSDLPQFGIIRSLRSAISEPGKPDFPATAMWIVHWKIHTPIGTVITDPKVPLVFGPTTVQHYPPVGTHFRSSTGPVDIMRIDTGEIVGKLTPGELTAFDIVVTMDDEIPSIMDKPAEYHVRMFNKIVNDPRQMIELTGLKNDYRIPASVLAEFESNNE